MTSFEVEGGFRCGLLKNGRLSDMDFQFAAVSAMKLEAEAIGRNEPFPDRV
ncbi:hypothetical protein AB395_00006758 (plasmid) [Sinorhizobium fredii CCBAU 45436]|nr:hypothetical protein AB395_00006758 [Sinorhizobium fredii CCBAU 45436]